MSLQSWIRMIRSRIGASNPSKKSRVGIDKTKLQRCCRIYEVRSFCHRKRPGRREEEGNSTGLALGKGHAPVVYMQGSGGAPAVDLCLEWRIDVVMELKGWLFWFLAPDLVRDEWTWRCAEMQLIHNYFNIDFTWMSKEWWFEWVNYFDYRFGFNISLVRDSTYDLIDMLDMTHLMFKLVKIQK